MERAGEIIQSIHHNVQTRSQRVCRQCAVIELIHRGIVFSCCIHVEAIVSTAVVLVNIYFFVVLHFTFTFVIFYSMHLAFITWYYMDKEMKAKNLQNITGYTVTYCVCTNNVWFQKISRFPPSNQHKIVL